VERQQTICVLGFVATGGNTRAFCSDWLHAGSSRANHFSLVHQLAAAITGATRVDCDRRRNLKLRIVELVEIFDSSEPAPDQTPARRMSPIDSPF
jgi:hypothetical protein